MSRYTSYPIMIGKGLRKGICAGKSQIMKGGVDLFVVWLNKSIKSGESFGVDDIESVNAVLHFCDRNSVKETIDVLTTVLLKWDEKEE